MQKKARGAISHSILGLAALLAIGTSQPVWAQAPAPAAVQTLIDRAAIEDFITRYYYNLGHGSADSFSASYVDGAELVLGAKSYKGREEIESAYKSTGDSPQRRAFSFNISISNLLVAVHGDTATARLIFTEILIDKPGEAPHLLVQGREYDTLAKVNGQWRFKKRQIVSGAAVPADWSE